MPAPLIALGLDALPPGLLETWTSQGKLPTLARLMEQGTYARQRNFDLYRTENSWLTLLHGCSPETSQEWGHQDYRPGDYDFRERASYDFKRYPPFYALPDTGRVAVFDVPLTGLVEGINGIQLLGWGTEVNQILRESSPPDMLRELIDRHGTHPLYDTHTNAEDGSERLSYRIPCLYDPAAMRDTRDKLIRATHQRTAIIRDLLQAERVDFLMAVYGEIHTAGHLFWHLSQAHPLHTTLRPQAGSDYLLDVLQAMDTSMASLIEDLPDEARLIVLSPHGMQSNSIDLFSMLFLPEFLYRWSTGNAAFNGQPGGSEAPSPSFTYRRHWAQEVWDLRSDHGRTFLESPAEQAARDDPLDWDPGNWYRRAWPTMRAFAVPGYSEGLIRINVAGRDGPDGIDPGDFGAIGDELEQLVREIKDPRTGDTVVQDILRVRRTPWEAIDEKSPADLMVLWREDLNTDVFEHPLLGQIGPVPYFRSGGHSSDGFVIARGPGFEPGRKMETVNTADVTATILDSLGVPPPVYVEGEALLGTGKAMEKSVAARA